MHELSIAQSILSIIEEEMAKNNLTKLGKVTVVNGELAGVIAEALEFAWQAITIDTDRESSTIEIKEMPVILRCLTCGNEFSPEGSTFAPCPKCGEELGHEVLQGKELYIENIEAE